MAGASELRVGVNPNFKEAVKPQRFRGTRITIEKVLAAIGRADHEGGMGFNGLAPLGVNMQPTQLPDKAYRNEYRTPIIYPEGATDEEKEAFRAP